MGVIKGDTRSLDNCFPKIGGTFWGSTIRVIVFLVYIVVPYFGKLPSVGLLSGTNGVLQGNIRVTYGDIGVI